MYSLVVIAFLSIVEANQEFTCKPQPGCHFARCSPLWPVTVPALRERNEFPINCVKNGTDPKDEDQDVVLDAHKQRISELTDELTEANEKIKELETNSDGTSQKMASKTQKLSELMAELTGANRKIKELEENSGYCPLLYEGSCYWVVYRNDNQVTFDQGRQICVDQGGMLADVVSKEQMYIIMGYMSAYARQHTLLDVWVDMTYNSQTKAVYLRDGSRAPYIKWYPGYPGNYCCNLILRSHAAWNDRNQYFFMRPSDTKLMGVLCQKTVS